MPSRKPDTFTCLLLLLCAAGVRAQDPPVTGGVWGVLVDKATGEPVIGAPIRFDGGDRVFIADEKGRFTLTGLPPGPHRLVVTDPEHQPFEASFDVIAGKTVHLRYALDPQGTVEQEEVVIRARRLEEEVSDTVLEMEEVKKIPGTQGDIVKIVQSLPGVARGLAIGGTSGVGIVVRGAAPEDSEVLIDGHGVPLLYHFGGLKSVLNSDMLKRIDFMPGGFGAEFGDAIGGIVDVQTRPCSSDRYDGYVELGMLDSGFFVEGPLGSEAGFIAAARRSTIDVWLPALLEDVDGFELTVAPVYYDYQAKLDWAPTRTDRLSALAFGSHDEMKFLLEKPPSGDPTLRGEMSMWVQFHRLHLEWLHAADHHWQLRVSLVGGLDRARLGIGEERYYVISVPNLSSRADLEWELGTGWKLKAGMQGWVAFFDSKLRLPRPPKEGEVPGRFQTQELIEGAEQLTAGGGALYASLLWRPWERLLLTGGLRLEMNAEPRFLSALMPRFSMKYQMRPGTVFKAGVGLYHQTPQQDELSSIFGNPELGLERAWHFTVGLEQDLPARIRVDFQAFYKTMGELVVTDPEKVYANGGVGEVGGLEVLIRKDLGDNLFGWLAYTLMRSQRRDAPDEPWRLFDFDQTHILTLVAGYQLPTGPVEPMHGKRDGWEFGVRFQLASGNPATPIVGAVFDADYDTYHRIPGDINSERLPYFHQLDVRVDYTWAWTTWALTLYLDVQNVYNHRNIEGIRYNYDATQRAYLEGLPIIPYLGLKGSF